MAEVVVNLLAAIGFVVVLLWVLDYLNDDSDAKERARIEAEVRRAERRMDEITHAGLEAMLAEAARERLTRRAK